MSLLLKKLIFRLKKKSYLLFKKMIIPVRCFTCNNVLASKYRRYLEIIADEEGKRKEKDPSADIISSATQVESKSNKTMVSASEIAFQQLNIKRYCCRRHLISHIDLVDKI